MVNPSAASKSAASKRNRHHQQRAVEEPLDAIVTAQLRSLDDADDLASAWADALSLAATADQNDDPAESEPSSQRRGRPLHLSWGGRGRGGRGLGRRTYQPKIISVENVGMEYVGDPGVVDSTAGGGGGSSNSISSNKVLLSDATLKLLPGRVYSIVGRNGCGKSSLLRRIDAGRVVGFPPHVSTYYVPQEVFGHGETSPLDVVLGDFRSMRQRLRVGNRMRIAELEEELERLDVEDDEGQAKVEALCDRISQLEEENDRDADADADDDDGDGDGDEEGDDDNERYGGNNNNDIQSRAKDALRFFGVPEPLFTVPTSKLSGGMRKKISLASALFSQPDLLLLDEPTNHLDVAGILQLRRLISSNVESKEAAATVVLVSHDVDLINDVTTDTIHFHDAKLRYYPGNYRDFLGYRRQGITCKLRQADALEKQRAAMVQTIDNLKRRSAGSKSRTTKKKLGKAIECRKKKLNRHGVENDEHGHRWTAQNQGCGIRVGSINGVDATSRGKLSYKELLKRAEVDIGPVPDKAVQFVFREVHETWGDEPLIMAMDVGHGYGEEALGSDNGPSTGYEQEQQQQQHQAVAGGGTDDGRTDTSSTVAIVRRPGMLFDCVDLCIREKSRTCILGENGSGKSTLLRLLAGTEDPLEGSVHHAHGVNVGHFHQHIADELIGGACEEAGGGADNATGTKMVTALSLLTGLFPKKSEQDLRGELTSFGLSPKQAATNVKFLSGGERCRLCMAAMMLEDPHVLILDEITNHLDVESVEAIVYGIKQWNGTVIIVSHDTNLIREIGGDCFVLMEKEGKLRRIGGGIDTYLKAFAPLL